jgi:hypothetical protein
MDGSSQNRALGRKLAHLHNASDFVKASKNPGRQFMSIGTPLKMKRLK